MLVVQYVRPDNPRPLHDLACVCLTLFRAAGFKMMPFRTSSLGFGISGFGGAIESE